MNILITGFDPFGGATINPAYEAVKRLPNQIGEAKLTKLEIPTVFKKDGEVLREAIEMKTPDVVLCIGQAGGRSMITVEKVAINLMEARIPDNEGQQPMDEPIAAGAKTAYFASLPVKAMVQNMKDHGIPAGVSYTAGTFVCNDIMYRLLHMIDTDYPNMRGGFIHVPYLPEQGVSLADGTATMSADVIAQALTYAIEAIVQHEDDIKGVGGTIM